MENVFNYNTGEKRMGHAVDERTKDIIKTLKTIILLLEGITNKLLRR